MRFFQIVLFVFFQLTAQEIAPGSPGVVVVVVVLRVVELCVTRGVVVVDFAGVVDGIGSP